MQVDLHTLYILCFGTLAVAGGMAMWDSLFNVQRRTVLRSWATAYALLFAGCILLYARAEIPALLAGGISNILIVSGYAMMVAGIGRMGGRVVPRALLPAAVALACLWLAIGPRLPFLYWDAFGSLAIAATQFVGVALLQATGLKNLRSRPVAVAIFATHGVVYLSRALMLPFLDSSLDGALLAFASKTTMFESVLYSVAAPAILLAMAREESENHLLAASQTDFLTDLLNRRAFSRRVGKLLASARPSGILLLFDLDHFKRVNDTYGHQTGDEVLQLFSRVVEAELRPQDIAARLGGEEFAAFLPGQDAREGETVALRIARRFSEAAAAGSGLPRLNLTVSTGLAITEGSSLDELVASADRALYRAKRLGRNRIERDDPAPLAA
ncbi:GGDEF domain-containing protein [Aureimonas sp. ME7]|uniref:GGDEF domain-containing protein n=1 Tax=Aureimonas sp. ME7 TaxID=2744252 RepID=UPI0015F4E942|nr:GGDEF domain-containing protein [Aureimonas sp. ME7]